jgi:hypothetical protein
LGIFRQYLGILYISGLKAFVLLDPKAPRRSIETSRNEGNQYSIARVNIFGELKREILKSGTPPTAITMTICAPSQCRADVCTCKNIHMCAVILTILTIFGCYGVKEHPIPQTLNDETVFAKHFTAGDDFLSS